MKKIIFAILTILIVGMFIGCASNSGISKTSKNDNKIFEGVYDESISDLYDDIYWVKTQLPGCPIRIDDRKVFALRKSSDPDRNIRLQNTFNRLINSSEISGRDYYKLLGCENFMREISEVNPDVKFFTLKDFLNEKNTINNNSITGKIINDTDEILQIGIYTRRQEQRHFYFEVPPHEERYFKILKTSELKESFLGIEDKYMNYDIAFVGIASPDKDKDKRSYAYPVGIDLLDQFASYLFDYYSFEITFDNVIHHPDFRDNLDSWRLVPRYDTQDNILIDALSYTEIETILNK